jgi:hypothetical protein
MITYIEKGVWMHRYIAEQGHWLKARDGVHISDDDVAVQAIIDAFDPLPYAIEDKRKELKKEVALRTVAIYGFMDFDGDQDDPTDAIAFYDFASDIYNSIIPAAQDILAPRLQSFKDVVDIGKLTNIQLNAQSDWEVVMTYDVTNTPAWP